MSVILAEPQFAQIATLLAVVVALVVWGEWSKVLVFVLGVAIVIAGIFSLLLRLVF